MNIKMDKAVVYGLGIEGRNIVESMYGLEEELGLEIVALVDKAEVKKEFRYPVYKPDSLLGMPYDYVLVTAQRYYDEIKKELIEKYAVKQEQIFLWHNWLVGRGKRRYYCNVCYHDMPLMLKAGYESPVFSVKKIVGGGSRDAAVCPFCHSYDRNRWVQYVLEHKTEIYERQSKILHFAPETMIEQKLRAVHQGEYITADINAVGVDRIEDITDISFKDGIFDYIICNHVLEHIKAEEKALSELKRCLKDDGKIIFSVPICWEEKTVEDERIHTDEQRLMEYGQEDHVRLYGNDLKERLEKSGFRVILCRVGRELTGEQIEHMRLLVEDTVWILEK